eukprot:650781-Ditylum_brightwellii.AAC.1
MPRKACHNAGLGMRRKKNCYDKYYTPTIKDRKEKKSASEHECSSKKNDLGKVTDDVDDILSCSESCDISEREDAGEVKDDIVHDVSVGVYVNIIQCSDVLDGGDDLYDNDS